MTRDDPAFCDSERSACDRQVALRPFSRSMSTPSKPYVCVSEYTEFAKFAGELRPARCWACPVLACLVKDQLPTSYRNAVLRSQRPGYSAEVVTQ
jgi:hypothetical protein